MNDLTQIILVVLLVVGAIGFFIAFTMMLLMRPARIDPDTGEPSYVWRACMTLCLCLSIVHIRNVFSVRDNDIESWWSVASRFLLTLSMIYLLWSLHRRHKALVQRGEYP